MSVYFNMSGSGNVKGARISAIESMGLNGVFHEGKLFIPSKEDIAKHIPHQWRKALDRAAIWFTKDTNNATIYLDSVKGERLSTIYLYGRIDHLMPFEDYKAAHQKECLRYGVTCLSDKHIAEGYKEGRSLDFLYSVASDLEGGFDFTVCWNAAEGR